MTSPTSVVAAPGVRPRQPTILVVDDDADLRNRTCRILRSAGYVAIPARQGMDAHWCLDERTGKVDLLITELLPPEPDGYHLGIAYRRVLAHTPVIFLSRASREENIRRGLLHPQAPFLPKPFSPEMLRRKVREVLKEWRSVPAA
ncbi:MAG TPA: response regulator [Gemmatimonadales bacterium]|nr:response regulator [Gemmatimonadales bacterium]